MRPAEWLQEVRMKRFEEAYDGWIENRLSQEEAARILGVSDRLHNNLKVPHTLIRRYAGQHTEPG